MVGGGTEGGGAAQTRAADTRGEHTRGERRGTLSIDLDTVRDHLRGYGVDADPAADGPLFRLALERWLGLLDEVGFRATFFTVGDTVELAPDLLRDAARAGHEVASHSLGHRQPFATLPDDELEREVSEPRRRIEAVTGVPVVGFRSPNFEIDSRVLRFLKASGHQYDASLLTGLCVLARQVVCRLRGASLGGVASSDWRGSDQPHRTPEGLVEFPVSRTGLVGLPLYGTVRLVVGDRLFDLAYRGSRWRAPFFSFAAHGVDLLSVEDGVDERLKVHPGVARPAESKRASLARFLRRMADDYSMKTYQQHCQEGVGAA